MSASELDVIDERSCRPGKTQFRSGTSQERADPQRVQGRRTGDGSPGRGTLLRFDAPQDLAALNSTFHPSHPLAAQCPPLCGKQPILQIDRQNITDGFKYS